MVAQVMSLVVDALAGAAGGQYVLKYPEQRQPHGYRQHTDALHPHVHIEQRSGAEEVSLLGIAQHSLVVQVVENRERHRNCHNNGHDPIH
jgi:hypothetical protein